MPTNTPQGLKINEVPVFSTDIDGSAGLLWMRASDGTMKSISVDEVYGALQGAKINEAPAFDTGVDGETGLLWTRAADGTMKSISMDEMYRSLNKRDIGMVSWFAVVPSSGDWLEMNGQSVAKSAYPDLESVTAYISGASSSSTYVYLPDWRDRFIRYDTSTPGTTQEDTIRRFDVSWMPSVSINMTSGNTRYYSTHNEFYLQGGLTSYAQSFNLNTNTPVADDNGEDYTPDYIYGISFDTDNILGEHSGVETQPQNVALRLCIKAR